MASIQTTVISGEAYFTASKTWLALFSFFHPEKKYTVFRQLRQFLVNYQNDLKNRFEQPVQFIFGDIPHVAHFILLFLRALQVLMTESLVLIGHTHLRLKNVLRSIVAIKTLDIAIHTVQVNISKITASSSIKKIISKKKEKHGSNNAII